MSFVRSLVTLVVAFLFVTFLFTAVTSYTLGDLLQEDNIKQFINTGVASELLKEQCSFFCQRETDVDACVDECVHASMGLTGETVEQAVEQMYQTEVIGIKVGEITHLLGETDFFAFLTIVCIIIIAKISEDPLNTIAKGMISVAISLILAGFSPNLIVGSTVAGIPVLGNMFAYLAEALNLQVRIGVLILVIAIVLLIAEKLEKRK